MPWFEIAASIVVLVCLAGVVLTLLTLPGIWLMVLAALVVKVAWFPSMFSWWTLAAAFVMAVVGEAVEFFASAAGASRSGGGRSGAVGSVVGGLIGAIAGTPVFPVVGTIAGAVIGAGVGAFVAERGIGGKTLGQSAKVGTGAAAGRFVAVVVKGAIAAAVAVQISVAAFV